nr:MAG TPA: hypothetical protein [Caudoviricetes sp.]
MRPMHRPDEPPHHCRIISQDRRQPLASSHKKSLRALVWKPFFISM